MKNKTKLDTGSESIDKPEEPKQWKIILFNDDYTPMDFVVIILKRFFHKTHEQAEILMLDVHKNGKGIAGIYSHEVAETKVAQVIDVANLNEFPLEVRMEEVN